MLKDRIFPRYKLKEIPFEVSSNESEAELKIYDISLSGVRLQSKKNLSEESIDSIEVSIKGEKFHLNLNVMWVDKEKGQENYSAGYRFSFNDQHKFQRWFTLIKAIHNLTLRKVKEKGIL